MSSISLFDTYLTYPNWGGEPSPIFNAPYTPEQIAADLEALSDYLSGPLAIQGIAICGGSGPTTFDINTLLSFETYQGGDIEWSGSLIDHASGQYGGDTPEDGVDDDRYLMYNNRPFGSEAITTWDSNFLNLFGAGVLEVQVLLHPLLMAVEILGLLLI